MAAGATVAPRAAAERPRYWSVLWRVGVGWYAAYLATAAVSFGLQELLYAGGDATEPPIPWLVTPGDAASVAANAPLGLLWVLLAVLAVRRLLTEPGDGLSVPLWVLAPITFAAGVLEVTAAPDDERTSALWIGLVAAFAIRQAPWRPVAHRVPPAGRAGIAALAVVALVVPALAVGDDRLLAVTDFRADQGYEAREGRTTRIALAIENPGRTPMTVTGVRLAGVPTGLTPGTVRLIPDVGYARPLTTAKLAPGDELTLDLAVAVPAGFCSWSSAVLATGAHVDARTADRRIARTLRPAQPFAVTRCAAR